MIIVVLGSNICNCDYKNDGLFISDITKNSKDLYFN